MVEQAKFGKVLEKQIQTIEGQGEKQIKRIEDQGEKQIKSLENRIEEGYI